MATEENPQRKGGKARRLKTVGGVRAFVAQVLRAIESEEMSVDKGRVLLYGAKILAELIQGSNWEERLKALEQKGAGYGPGNQTSVSQ